MRSSNYMKLSFSCCSENESFARIAVAGFLTSVDPTFSELDEIKTVVSEAVTNSIIHGYADKKDDLITVEAEINEDIFSLSVSDQGIGIANISLARQPLYTSRPELERSGMGFTIMENFMDEFEIHSVPGKGTTVRMKKKIAIKKAIFT